MNFHLKILLPFLLSANFLCFNSFAQNLVPNPSFEVLDSCPDGSSQIDRATGWIPFTSSPDFFHECGLTFNQFQCQNTGKGKASIFSYSNILDNHEIMGIELSTPLVIGEKYYVSFKAKLHIDSRIGINKLGAIFTIKKYCYSLDDFTNLCDSTPMPINNWAHIVSNDIIIDTANWTTVFGSFIADSTYRYIAIGHFFDRTLTDTIMFDVGFSNLPRYFIDDICVSNDSLTCIDITTEIIDFQADSTMIQENSCVNFTVNTIVNYDFYQWIFPGAIPDSSNDSTPANICYDTTGNFDVLLIASTSKGCADTVIKSNYITVTNLNSIDELRKKNQEQLFIFPNPATERINISFPPHYRAESINIYDVYGNLVINEDYFNNFHKTIDISTLVSGFYIVKVKSKNTIYKSKLLITSKP